MGTGSDATRLSRCPRRRLRARRLAVRLARHASNTVLDPPMHSPSFDISELSAISEMRMHPLHATRLCSRGRVKGSVNARLHGAFCASCAADSTARRNRLEMPARQAYSASIDTAFTQGETS
jgi:hypothetical protein